MQDELLSNNSFSKYKFVCLYKHHPVIRKLLVFSSPKFIASIGVRVVMATMAAPSLVTKQRLVFCYQGMCPRVRPSTSPVSVGV